MTLAREEFAAAFPRENDHVEFKRGASDGPLQEAIVSFSNTDGGVILLGVQDDGTVLGRELTPGTADDIHRAVRNTHDPGRYAIAQIHVDGVPVTVISVAARVEGFSQTSNGRVLVRRGTLKMALLGDDLRRFISDRSLQRFEESDAQASLEDASDELLVAIRELYGWSDDGIEARLSERGLLVPGSDQLSVAGALYLLDDPSAYLGKSYVEILRFPEGAKDYDRRVEIRGPIDRQLQAATAFVSDELGSELVVLGLRRHQLPRLPVVVLREAIANALAHRSYELHGSAIRIEIRPDRVSILSPGGLPEPVTVENIREAQSARNLHVISVLRRFGLAEDAGRGIDVMVDSMRQELLEAPRFEDTGHSVEVTLPIRSAVTPEERAWVREVESRGLIEAGDSVILVHAARGEVLTNSRVRELLAVDAFAAREALHRLRDAGFLNQRGARGGATYVLGESLAPPAGLRLGPDALKKLLVEMASEEPLTNAKVRLRTGLERTEALRLLDDLVDTGRLVRVGERRGTRYLLPPDPAA